ncbi:MAG: hypothetical protein DRJ43_00630 [Thermoprotei archaeon]|nr:MAG: hypothetical protein DRJ43_00630 [Thermoprotei archaeon]
MLITSRRLGGWTQKGWRRDALMSGEDPALLKARFDELRESLRSLEKEALELRQKRDELNSEVRRLSAEIRALSSEYREVKEQVAELKARKEELYSEIQKVKSERNQVREDLRALSEEVKSMLNEIKILRDAIGRRRVDIYELRERLERLEWEYQTRTLSPEEEKFYVERIRNTESMLVAMEKYNECMARIRELRQLIVQKRSMLSSLTARLRELSARYLEVKGKLAELAEKGGALRTKLSEMIERKEELRRQADEYHARYLEKVRELKRVREELEKTAILLKAVELSQVLSRRRAELYEVAMRALEKYRQGESLTLDEFKLLMEFNLL